MGAGNPQQLSVPAVPGVAASVGDLGGQLIANLMLIGIACEFDTLSNVKRYVERALATALEIGNHCITYRPARPLMFAKFTFGADREIDALLLPVVSGRLIIPDFGSSQLACQGFPPPSIEIMELELVYFIVRLRLRKIAAVLKDLGAAPSSEDIAGVMRAVLSDCLRSTSTEDLFSLAADYFSLARGLIGSRNFPIAAVALRKGEIALEALTKEQGVSELADAIQTMRQRIADIAAELRRGAV
jgi:hypothetical protein